MCGCDDRRAPVAAAPPRVQEAELFERDGTREGDDREAHAADAESRDGGEEPEHGGDGRSDQRRDREGRPDRRLRRSSGGTS